MGQRDYRGRQEELARSLRERGVKATPARVDILAALARQRYPVSIRELVVLVCGYDESTLHRSLATLERAGLVKKIMTDPAQSRYETAIDRPHHHHVTCTSCGAMEDIPDCAVDLALRKVARRLRSRGFCRITDHSLEFFGLCNRCAPG